MVTMMSGLRLRREWLLLVAILPLLVALVFLGAYALYIRDETVVYWLTMLYDYTAFGLVPLVASVGLAVLFLAAFGILQIAVEHAAARPRLAKSHVFAIASVLLLCLLCVYVSLLYWLTILYGWTALGLVPLVASVGVAVLFLVAYWATQVAVERTSARPGLAKPYSLTIVSILLLCLFCVCGSYLLISDMIASTHVDSLQRGAHVYRLAYKPTLGFTFDFVVYECDATGMFCHARSETCAGHEGDSTDPTLPAARLRVDAATGAVSAQIPASDIFPCGSLEPYP